MRRRPGAARRRRSRRAACCGGCRWRAAAESARDRRRRSSASGCRADRARRRAETAGRRRPDRRSRRHRGPAARPRASIGHTPSSAAGRVRLVVPIRPALIERLDAAHEDDARHARGARGVDDVARAVDVDPGIRRVRVSRLGHVVGLGRQVKDDVDALEERGVERAGREIEADEFVRVRCRCGTRPMARTRTPAARSRRTRRLPMKPVAPVTSPCLKRRFSVVTRARK